MAWHHSSTNYYHNSSDQTEKCEDSPIIREIKEGYQIELREI